MYSSRIRSNSHTWSLICEVSCVWIRSDSASVLVQHLSKINHFKGEMEASSQEGGKYSKQNFSLLYKFISPPIAMRSGGKFYERNACTGPPMQSYTFASMKVLAFITSVDEINLLSPLVMILTFDFHQSFLFKRVCFQSCKGRMGNFQFSRYCWITSPSL